jgi:hypothetical protein
MEVDNIYSRQLSKLTASQKVILKLVRSPTTVAHFIDQKFFTAGSGMLFDLTYLAACGLLEMESEFKDYKQILTFKITPQGYYVKNLIQSNDLTKD